MKGPQIKFTGNFIYTYKAYVLLVSFVLDSGWIWILKMISKTHAYIDFKF